MGSVYGRGQARVARLGVRLDGLLQNRPAYISAVAGRGGGP